jgi:hypothetical protein
LIEFNHEIWNSWILEGYKFIRYRRIDENRVALKPFREIDPEQDLEEMYNFFRIREDEVSEWADNDIDLLPDFKFLVEE